MVALWACYWARVRSAPQVTQGEASSVTSPVKRLRQLQVCRRTGGPLQPIRKWNRGASPSRRMGTGLARYQRQQLDGKRWGSGVLGTTMLGPLDYRRPRRDRPLPSQCQAPGHAAASGRQHIITLAVRRLGWAMFGLTSTRQAWRLGLIGWGPTWGRSSTPVSCFGRGRS